MTNHTLPCLIKSEADLNSPAYDGVILVSSLPPQSERHLEPFKTSLQKAAELDQALGTEGAVLEISIPARRFIYAPTGPLNQDYDDVRSFGEAAGRGINRALKAGVKAPLLVVTSNSEYPRAELVTLLGALEALYVPIQVREDVPSKKRKVEVLGVWASDVDILNEIIPLASALESGRFVARDIGGGDPERMAPPRVEEYVRKLFGYQGDSNVSMEVINDPYLLEKEYPLYSAVNRAASVIDRHKGRIIYLHYGNNAGADKTLFLIGKGVTYDTGGADIKAGGVMAGMSRDKCGAAAVAGFMQVLEKLRPKGIRVVGVLSLVRNSVGENCYVADEVITARSQARVRIGNTDAEGRMIMADVLCRAKELAIDAVNPQLMTIATLTGHAALTVGPGYTIILDNGPARSVENAQKLQASAALVGDMFEISTIRREDIAFHRGKSEGDDVFQCNNLPSSRTPRGHQGPAGFLILASGLDKGALKKRLKGHRFVSDTDVQVAVAHFCSNNHGTSTSMESPGLFVTGTEASMLVETIFDMKNGLDSKKPIPYSHLDIAGSSGDLPHEPTGAPVLGLVSYFLQGRY